MATYTQSHDLDEQFYKRADGHIQLANKHLDAQKSAEMVNSSFLYAAARFNAWISAAGLSSQAEMALKREELIGYFTDQYRAMLEENLDDYITNYGRYLGVKKEL